MDNQCLEANVSRVGSADMQSAIERLKRLAQEEENETQANGTRLGREWAMEAAKPSELRRLKRFRESEGYDICMQYRENDAYEMERHLLLIISGDEDMDRNDREIFWGSAIGDMEKDLEQLNDPEFMKAFVEGAIQFWDEVENDI